MPLDPSFDRLSGIGASEAAAVLGLDPFRTPFQVWLEKTGRAAPFAGNAYTDLGNRLEPVVADLYAERFSVALVATGTHREPSGLPIFASPDRLVSGLPVAVECKAHLTPNIWSEYGEDGSTKIPAKYAVQDHVQAAVCDLERVDHAALVRGEVRVYRILRDHAYERMIFDQLAAWWEKHVVLDSPPEPDGTPAYGDWIKSRFPKHQEVALIASDEDVPLVRAVLDAYAAREAADLAYEQARQAIQERMRVAASIEAPGIGRISWRSTRGKTTTDWEALALSMKPTAEQIEAHKVVSPGSRRFIVSKES